MVLMCVKGDGANPLRSIRRIRIRIHSIELPFRRIRHNRITLIGMLLAFRINPF